MNGIASLLDPPANSKVEHLWEELEFKCGLQGVRITPFPHFTWQVTEGYELPKVDAILREFSRNAQPFIIRTDGLGVFTGEKPVLYISIFKDDILMELHSILWEQTRGFVANPDPLYSPSFWTPHITLAYNDLTEENAGCAFQSLIFRSFNWEIKIDNLIFISQAGGQSTEIGKYQLGN